jgi:hypothetical protein
MKHYYPLIIIITVLFSFNSSAAVRPVAAEVEKMHNLNVAFRNYELFVNAHPIGESLQRSLTEGTEAELLPGKLGSLVAQANDAISVSIPFEGSTITVDLVRTNIFTDDFTVLTGNNDPQHYTPGVYYRGIIHGNPNSISSFSFFNNQVYGIISDDVHGNVVIGKLNMPGNLVNYVIYSAHNLTKHFDNFCHTTENYRPFVRAQNPGTGSNTVLTTKCARIYYEIDFTLFNDNNSDVTTTTNWITAIHNNVQTLYANDNISVAFSQCYIWTTNDPYQGANSTDQLITFRATRTSFNGDVAELVARDGGFGGLGYLDVLCTSQPYCYADVDFTFSTVPTYSWTVEVMTHEIGHNLGSPHTHNCGWPVGALDDCYATEGGCPPGPTPSNGGTIMSYCHLSSYINFNNGFGPYPRDTIIYAVNHAACLGSSCAVCMTPAHDACASAANLVISSNCVRTAGNLCGSTQSIPPITCNGFTAAHGYDVWYKITPAQTPININCISGTSTNVVIGFYSGACGAMTLVDCSDATGTGGTETLSETVTTGTTYYIRVYDHNSATVGTDFSICVSENCLGSTNNSCASATALTIGSSCSYTNGDLCAATQSQNPSQCSGYTAQTAYDLWYAITPNQPTVQITASSGANTDLILGIYSGTCGNLNLIRCIDTTGAGGIEQFTVTLTPGNTYYLRLYDWDGNQYGTDFGICAKYICTIPNAATAAAATPSSFCAGDSTTISLTGTLSAGASWHWYSGTCGGTAVGIGSTLRVAPPTTRSYFVRAENGSCFSTCKAVTVSVTQIPNAANSASANPSSVCAGGSTALTVSGTLTNGAGWFWYADSCGGAVINSGATVNVNPTGTTTYYVRAQNGSCYSACVSTPVTISAAPNDPASMSATNDSICPGDSTTLSVNGTLSAGATWHWYSASCGSADIGSGNSITITPNSTSTYYVRAVNGTCYSNCVSKNIYRYASPGTPNSAGPSVSICDDASVTLNVNGTLGGGSTWKWYADSCGGTNTGTGTSITVTPDSSTTYYVRAENAGCQSSCVTATVILYPALNTPPVSIINDTASVTGTFNAYQWYYSATGISYSAAGSTQEIPATANGFYFVDVIDSNGCSINSDTLHFITSGMQETYVGNLFSIYPNPVSNILNIESKDRSANEFTCSLYDATGKLVYTKTVTGHKATLNLAAFAAGIYDLVIVSNNRLLTQKLLKN